VSIFLWLQQLSLSGYIQTSASYHLVNKVLRNIIALTSSAKQSGYIQTSASFYMPNKVARITIFLSQTYSAYVHFKQAAQVRYQ
jgi:hypothetical protein